jgi:hypothetical protein
MSMDNQHSGSTAGESRFTIDPALSTSMHLRDYGYSRAIEDAGLSCWQVAQDFTAATAGRVWSALDPFWVAVEEYLESRGFLEAAA